MRARRLLVIAICIAASHGCDKRRSTLSDGYDACKTDCLELPGLKGLGFGMTELEAESVIGKLKPIDYLPPIKPTIKANAAERRAAAVRQPGFGYFVKTKLGELPASCRLYFLVADRLSRIECRIDGAENKKQAFDLIFGRIIARHVPPHTQTAKSARWTSETAVFEVDRDPSDLHRPYFRLETYLRADQKLHDSLVQKANARVVTQREAKKRAQEEATRALERQRSGKDDALDRDLSAAPEQPASP